MKYIIILNSLKLYMESYFGDFLILQIFAVKDKWAPNQKSPKYMFQMSVLLLPSSGFIENDSYQNYSSS